MDNSPVWLKAAAIFLFLASTSFLIMGKDELFFVTSGLLIFIASLTRTILHSKQKDKSYNFNLVMTIFFGLSLTFGIFYFFF
ncbi:MULTISPECIES: hypothetical protein [Bacillaceae]|uniref:hypothetical protein n=1 Tax=Bacillaceae TaxID=186817 RepID=UPI000C771937|nr:MULTISPECIES: hypothetical protein [Bacillus]MDW2876839.1 hypothetical protein [Bacillus infantis]PLR74190.1 hypothetical protein CYJ37_00725 [Bacillus sp. UMB0728]